MRMALLVGTVLWAAVVTATPQAVIRPDADACLNLRASPQSSATVVACLAPGTSVAVLEQAPYWRKVRSGSHEGWAAKKYLEDSAVPPPAGETEDQWLEYGNQVFLFMGDAEGKERHGAANAPEFVERILLDTMPERLRPRS
jgi:hypothetical protein